MISRLSGYGLRVASYGLGVAVRSCCPECPRGRIRPGRTLRTAPETRMPATADSNSPAHWSGDTLYVFNSWNHPSRSAGRDQFSLGAPLSIRFEPPDPAIGNRWIEATWPDDDGTLYGWYHNEPKGLCPGSETRTKYGLTAPRIGAVRSRDNGATWEDLGLVLTAPVDLARLSGAEWLLRRRAWRFLRDARCAPGVAVHLLRQLCGRRQRAGDCRRAHALGRPRRAGRTRLEAPRRRVDRAWSRRCRDARLSCAHRVAGARHRRVLGPVGALEHLSRALRDADEPFVLCSRMASGGHLHQLRQRSGRAVVVVAARSPARGRRAGTRRSSASTGTARKPTSWRARLPGSTCTASRRTRSSSSGDVAQAFRPAGAGLAGLKPCATCHEPLS